MPRQRVARHLAKARPENGDFRACEARLLRYLGGLVPKPRDLEELILAPIVRPAERVADVSRWLREGGPEPDYVVTFDDSPGPAAPLPAVVVAQPSTLRTLLEAVRSGVISVDEAETTLEVQSKLRKWSGPGSTVLSGGAA